MNDWVTYCVNRCMKSEVIALTSFCIATQKSMSRSVNAMHLRTHSRLWWDVSLIIDNTKKSLASIQNFMGHFTRNTKQNCLAYLPSTVNAFTSINELDNIARKESTGSATCWWQYDDYGGRVCRGTTLAAGILIMRAVLVSPEAM